MKNKSAADNVLFHKILIALNIEKEFDSIFVGIDMSKAFDTVEINF